MVQPLRSQERPPPPPPPTDALPVAPVQDARPTEPVQDVRPTEPIPDARPTEPIPDARPTEPVQDARPTERVQDALPAVDADAPPPPPPMDTQKPADERPPRQDEDRPTPAGRSSPGAPPIGGAAEAGNPVVSLVSMRAGPTAASGPCEEDGKQSMSVNVDDDRLEVRWSNENCSIRVSARGDIEFTPDFRAIKSMSSGSRFQFEERQGTERRELEIQSRDGQLEYRWRVDGRDRPYDTAAREWFADMLVLFFRVTGYQAEERATWILAQQGAGGLLAEAERIRSDYGQRKYLLVLLEKGDPDDDMVSQVIQLAGRDIGSDHELGKLLEASTENRTLSGSNRRAYIEATRSMGSDHQQSQTLAHLMATERLDEAELRLLLNAALAIGSDHDAAELLIAVNENIDDLDRETRDAFLATAGTIGSDHQLYRVLSALAERPDLSNGDLTALLDASAEIGSDHQQAALLIEIADSHSLQGASRDAYLRAVDMIGSSHQRDQARKALLASG
jgi:hypothetical protein